MKKTLKKKGNKLSQRKTLFNIKEVVIIALIFAAITSIFTGTIVYSMNKNLSVNKNILDLISSYNKIKNNYYEKVDENGLVDAAIDGMMNFLNEKYSVYLNEAETELLDDKLNGSFRGIGVLLAFYKDKISILDVYVDTPAYKKGLKEQDQILVVNDLIVNEKTTMEDISKISQNAKSLKLTIKRGEETLYFDVPIETINNPVAYARIINHNDNNIGYIVLNNFSNESFHQFSLELADIEASGIDSLIIDLRGNSGGYMKQALQIANMFLRKDKTICTLKYKNKTVTYKDTTDEKRDYDIVVLVDSKTASASELLASALKENNGSLIVGTNSFGKGSVQQLSKLSKKDQIKYTTAKWYTPLGNTIDKEGIIPGIYIEYGKDLGKDAIIKDDSQLNEAIKALIKK